MTPPKRSDIIYLRGSDSDNNTVGQKRSSHGPAIPSYIEFSDDSDDDSGGALAGASADDEEDPSSRPSLNSPGLPFPQPIPGINLTMQNKPRRGGETEDGRIRRAEHNAYVRRVRTDLTEQKNARAREEKLSNPEKHQEYYERAKEVRDVREAVEPLHKGLRLANDARRTALKREGVSAEEREAKKEKANLKYRERRDLGLKK